MDSRRVSTSYHFWCSRIFDRWVYRHIHVYIYFDNNISSQFKSIQVIYFDNNISAIFKVTGKFEFIWPLISCGSILSLIYSFFDLQDANIWRIWSTILKWGKHNFSNRIFNVRLNLAFIELISSPPCLLSNRCSAILSLSSKSPHRWIDLVFVCTFRSKNSYQRLSNRCSAIYYSRLNLHIVE